MESGEAETLNRIQWRMPGAPKPSEMSKSQDNPKQSQAMNTNEVLPQYLNRILQCETKNRKMVSTNLQKQKYRRRRTRNMS